jgi:multidrug efflux pump subunit AcrA (membrane-fusion protein)
MTKTETKMNPSTRLLSALVGMMMLATALNVGAEQGHEPAAKTTDSAPPTVAELRQEWAEAVDAFNSYSAAQREAALARAKTTLQAMDARIEQLQAQADDQWDQLSQSARQKRQATLRALREQRNRVAEWYGGMKHSSAGAWDDVKDGFVGAYGILTRSFGNALAEFDSDEGEKR